MLILEHEACTVPTLLAVTSACKQLRDLNQEAAWKAKVLQRWPPAGSLRVASFKRLYAAWSRAELGENPPCTNWRALLDKLNFVVSIHRVDLRAPHEPHAAGSSVVLQTTLRGVDAIPATDYSSLWPDYPLERSEGLGWTVQPATSALRAAHVVSDEGQAKYNESITRLYDGDSFDNQTLLTCSCTVVRDEPQAVGVLVQNADFQSNWDGTSRGKIFFETDSRTRASMYLALDFSGATPQWRLLLDMKLVEDQHDVGDSCTSDAVREIVNRVQWHE